MSIDYLYYYWNAKTTGKRIKSYALWQAEQNVIEAFGGKNLFSKAKK